MFPLMFNKRASLKIIIATLAVICFLVPDFARATTQFSDIIYLNGEKYSLDSLPLEQYYGPQNPRPKFRAPNTATWRGYIATWEINRDFLQLKAIRAWTDQGEVGMETLFPGQKVPVAATWFTGRLKVPQGKMLKPAVPYPISEKYLMIKVEKGKVVSQEVVDNPNGNSPPK